MCDKNKCVEDTFQVSAPVDRQTCLLQASLAYNMYVEEDRKGKKDTAQLWMGIAHVLYHLHDGSYSLLQTCVKPNRGVY